MQIENFSRSLGCLVVEMLTEKPPNGDVSKIEDLEHRLKQKILKYDKLPGFMGENGRKFVTSLLDFDVKSRPTAAEASKHQFLQ